MKKKTLQHLRPSKPPKAGSKAFKELQAAWYEVLKQDGFVEIEDTNSPREYLKTWASRDFVEKNQDWMEARRLYYQWAANALNTFKFKSTRDRRIWELHAEGITGHQIGKLVKISKAWAYKEIERIEAEIKEADQYGQ